MELSDGSFSLTLGDFSGPLDLLCHLIESRAMDASTVRLTDVLSQYVSFLVTNGRATLVELAEFFSLASRLMLGKIRSLLPRAAEDPEDDASGVEDEIFDEEADEEALRAMLVRFMPYRAAASLLLRLQTEREAYFTRDGGEGGEPWFDIDDLYGLASHWWSLIDERSRSRASRTEVGFMAEIPDAVPEEILVEQRMDEVQQHLREQGSATFSGLIERFGSGGVIVTLLALLELSRLGKLDMVQAEPWGDVEIAAA